jgi:folate-binding protein YgfZ
LKDLEYTEAYRSAVYFVRTDRVLRRVRGKSPAQMLTGILSGSMPPDLQGAARSAGLAGRAPWSAILSPKGKVISDVRVSRLENGEAGALLLDLPSAGAEAALAHLARYLPPRLARVETLDAPAGVISVVGPAAPALLAAGQLQRGAGTPDLASSAEGEEWLLPDGSEVGIRAIRTSRALPPSFDVIASAPALLAVEEEWLRAGATKGTQDIGEVLRVERGIAAFGIDIDDQTLPMEAGLEDRYIDREKGCYTGQEVIVRIRDRGHVNRLLRGILLGDAPIPSPGTPLVLSDEERIVGEIRSAVRSPGFGQGIALAFVRREIVPPATLSLGGPAGLRVAVRELTPQGWRLVPGDPSLDPSPPAHPAP